MQTVKKIFPVIGMSCASCAISVESMLQPVNGVVHAHVNYAAQQVMVEYDESVVTPQKLKSFVQSIGYDLMIDEKGDIHKSTIDAGILYPVNGFLLNPMIAGAAMAFSSVSVVLSSLLLKTIRL